MNQSKIVLIGCEESQVITGRKATKKNKMEKKVSEGYTPEKFNNLKTLVLWDGSTYAGPLPDKLKTLKLWGGSTYTGTLPDKLQTLELWGGSTYAGPLPDGLQTLVLWDGSTYAGTLPKGCNVIRR